MASSLDKDNDFELLGLFQKILNYWQSLGIFSQGIIQRALLIVFDALERFNR